MSIAIRDPQRQRLYQVRLLQELATAETSRRRYEWILIRDLRPAWKSVAAKYWPGAALTTLGQVLTLEENQKFELGRANPDLAEYVDKLRSRVADSFRLRWNGQPAYWALEAIHGHVVYGTPADCPPILPYAHFPFSREATLAISVSEDYVSLTLATPGEDVTTRTLAAGGALTFRDWDRLESAAIEAVKSQVAEIRRAFEDDYERTASSSYQRRRIDNAIKLLPVLARVLVAPPLLKWMADADVQDILGTVEGKKDSVGAVSKRLKRICADMGLDWPDKNK